MAIDPAQEDTMPTAPRGASVDFDLEASRTVAQTRDVRPMPSSPPSADHIALPAGFTLHEYTFEKPLGSGGFGLTYLARDANLQCQVAIKEYLPNDLALRLPDQSVAPRSADDAGAYRAGLERFLAEARVLAGFRHPNIVRVTRFFEANGTAYMVMDYERGESLRAWQPRHEHLDEATLKRMLLPLLDGLAVVHAAGVVHRDIKPANIYVRDADGSLVLLDFGAARQTSGVPEKSLTSIVTPGYAPFEQYHTRGAQGPWTDLYALAGVLYWLVTGHKPLEAPSRVKEDTMPAAAVLAAGRFSASFLAAIDWALQVNEDARPQSVAAFRAVLLGEAEAPPTPTASAAPAPTKRHGPKAAVIAALTLAIVAIAFVVWPTKAPPPAAGTEPTPAAASSPVASAGQSGEATPVRSQGKTAAAPPAGAAKPGSAAAAAPRPGTPATVVFDIDPPGEAVAIDVDGKRIGTSPPLKEYALPSGAHKISIHGNKMPFVHHYRVDLKPGERKQLTAKFSSDL